ncbi:MAG TPA: alpha/beta hydrolase-fold protein [Rhodocyclaceae bacterium]|nr:alpha/beta hydrolase-fold protein [Rhodocyclaceae bacterium]
MKIFWGSSFFIASVFALLAACAPLPWANSPQARSTTPAFSQHAEAYEVVDLDWIDQARQREVPVRLYLPKTSSAGKPVPLVLFSHGMGGSRNGYSYLADDWASHGIASLHVQHVGSDRSVWQGSRIGVLWQLQQAASAGEAMARAQDMRFALDQLLASPDAVRIARERIAVAGHSYGANTAMLVAGAHVMQHGEVLALSDARIKAAILISSPPFYGEDDFAPILQSIRAPTLHITSTADVIEVPGYHSDVSDRIKVFNAIGSRDKALAVFKGGSHSMFTDRSNTGGATLNPLVKQATSELTRLFLLRQFAEASPRQDINTWQQLHADILDSFQTAPLLSGAVTAR